jgi:serine/threonine protein kinase
VLAPISDGGMASVWLGRSTEHPEQLVALKVIRPEHARNKEFIAMFRDEAKIASRLAHPNIVTIHGLGHDGRQFFLAMEVLRGRSLLDLWEAAHDKGKRIPLEVSAWLGARVADALHHAHEMLDDKGEPQHIVHRDVNPANIFITRAGTPKLIDFGLAKARDRLTLTAMGVVKGKLAYLAPEQVAGKAADRRADVFALGVTLWEVTLDRRLFRQDTDAATVRRVRDAAVPDPVTIDDDYPRALSDVIVRALARDPADRWQTAAELRDALDAYVRDAGRAIDEAAVSALVSELSTGDAAADWEHLVEEAEVGPERIRVWDDERQKLTWMNASIEDSESSDGATTDGAAPIEPPATTPREQLDRALAARLTRLDPGDGVAVARAHLERALVDEALGDGSTAALHAEASLEGAPSSVAHAMLRRLGHARGAAKASLTHLDAELEACASTTARADLLAERARLLEASGQPVRSVRAAWELALAANPSHAAAMRGLEAELVADADAREALAAHLQRIADAYAAEPRLAAWIHVERARVLDRDLAQNDSAKAALTRALVLDPGAGPVRQACVAHATAHGDAAWLTALLMEEAALVGDYARAAALEVDAACLARHRLGDPARAAALLESAAGRPAVTPAVRHHALEALVELHEAAGRPADALRARQARLAMVSEPRVREHQLRAIAATQESLGNRDGAIAALEEALALSPADSPLAEELDRILETGSLTQRRIDLWIHRAAAADDPRERARRLVRAARLAESLGDTPQAIAQLRAALVAHPSDEEAVDHLLRLLSAPPTTGSMAEARARVAVHAHAAEHSVDPARRIAHLEAIALLEEETLGDTLRAAGTYEAILRLEPGRRGAVVGLARTAARAGDAARLSRALLDEAAATTDTSNGDALRLRAADALTATDAERALAIVHEVLKRDPSSGDARRIEQHLHEAAGRWAQVDTVLATRIEHEKDPRRRVSLLLARAEVQRTRLQATREALASLRAVLAIDRAHPGAREATAALLEALGDPRALRDGLVELASSEATAAERARMLVRAAEIDELVLSDDEHAAELLARALAETPDDAWIEERRLRVLARRARAGHTDALRTALAARQQREPESPAHALTLALVLLDDHGDVAQATALLELVRQHDPTAPHALRTLERIARATKAAPLLANVLDQQADVFGSDVARLGALWALAALVEWRLPESDATELFDRILRLAPGDRAALDAIIRLALPKARAGDATARSRLIAALGARLGQASSSTETLYLRLSLALAMDTVDGDARQALEQYREALRVDDGSVVAAAGAARLGAALADAEASVVAAVAQAGLVSDPRARAAYLVQAASQTLSAQDARLGARPERLARAGDLLERALDADPEALPAVALLVAVRGEDGNRDRLLGVLRAAFERARSAQAIVLLGGEVARVASIDPPDRVLAIEALRRILAAAPGHAATLRALADQYVAQGAWGEASLALETLASRAQDPRAKLAALLQLAELYAGSLPRPSEVERVLRTALDADPTSLEAMQRLVTHLRETSGGVEEIRSLLARIAEVEPRPEARAAALDDLATLDVACGDVPAAERALVESTALVPTAARIARIMLLRAGAPADQARAMSAVVERQQDLDRPDAASLAALGLVETSLGRWPDAVSHLRIAITLAPALHEARAALARALVRMRSAVDAMALVMQMITPDAAPLLMLGDPAAALATLESALDAEGRVEEATVARELRALAGGLDDGTHAALRARRIVVDPSAPVPIALDPVTLRGGVAPQDMPPMLLDLAAAIAGAEAKLVRVGLEELGVEPHDRMPPASRHPLLPLVYRLATLFGVARPEVALSTGVVRPRVVMKDVPWLVVPEALLEQPEPVQTASLALPLVRVALAVPWLEDYHSAYAHAVLCGAARQVVPSFASEIVESEQQDLIEDFTKRISRAIGRKQKKALAELAPVLSNMRTPTLADVGAFEQAVAKTELRAAFVTTGDLLSTLDVARALDTELGRATTSVGVPALGATLAHPLAGDVARFALSQAATALRWRAGTLWGRPA